MSTRLSSAFLPAALLAAAVLSPTPAAARIGWTLDECRTNWGTPLGKDAARNSESEESFLFEKKVTDEKSGFVTPILIHAEFKAGKVWLVRYAGSLKMADRTKLLEVNKGETNWEESESYLNRQFWVTKEKKDRLACEYKLGARTVVEVMTSECLRSLTTQKAAVEKTVVDNPNYQAPLPNRDPSGEETKAGSGTPGASATGSKLDGF
ncbi:MAG: hypothetical protein KA004_13355 [Verrucomicrobiales bacterium]|nr:hypothetical protein [Verrucomicrobiales bacterium]